jgi:hypothetical protein
MSGWVKIPEEWLDSPDLEELPAEVIVLHLSALAYCARHSSNGVLRRGDLRKLWPALEMDKCIDLLERLEWWLPTAVGWLIEDWRTFILSADEVDQRREMGRKRQERYRRHLAGDHSMCDRCSHVRAGNASRNASVTPSVTPPPNRSEPLRPVGEERREEAAQAGAAGALPAGLQPHPFDWGVALDTAADDEAEECCPLPREHPIHIGRFTGSGVSA